MDGVRAVFSPPTYDGCESEAQRSGSTGASHIICESQIGTSPVGELHFYGLAAAEVVDDGAKGDGQRAGGAVKVVFPVAAAERDRAERNAVLLESQRKVAAGGA